MPEYKIRAHHVMCLAFFEGKGYSYEFVEHMTKIKNNLDKNPKVILTSNLDEICRFCPNNHISYCETEAKVLNYDMKVLELCELNIGHEIYWKEFEKIVEEKILKLNKRINICGDCFWNSICESKEQKKFLK